MIVPHLKVIIVLSLEPAQVCGKSLPGPHKNCYFAKGSSIYDVRWQGGGGFSQMCFYIYVGTNKTSDDRGEGGSKKAKNHLTSYIDDPLRTFRSLALQGGMERKE